MSRQPTQPVAVGPTRVSPIVPDNPEFVPLVNAYMSVAAVQLAKVTVAVPIWTVDWLAGVFVSKMPPVVW